MDVPKRRRRGRATADGVSDAFMRLKELTDEGRAISLLDERPTYGQLHQLVINELGMEPLQYATLILAMARVSKNRMNISPLDSARLAIMIHDRMVPMPDRSAVKRSAEEDQFTLEFAWQDKEPIEGEVVQ